MEGKENDSIIEVGGLEDENFEGKKLTYCEFLYYFSLLMLFLCMLPWLLIVSTVVILCFLTSKRSSKISRIANRVLSIILDLVLENLIFFFVSMVAQFFYYFLEKISIQNTEKSL